MKTCNECEFKGQWKIINLLLPNLINVSLFQNFGLFLTKNKKIDIFGVFDDLKNTGSSKDEQGMSSVRTTDLRASQVSVSQGTNLYHHLSTIRSP